MNIVTSVFDGSVNYPIMSETVEGLSLILFFLISDTLNQLGS